MLEIFSGINFLPIFGAIFFHGDTPGCEAS